jgi:hypothetical protein
MTVIGTEYVFAAKLLCWGGGSYVQIMADLQKKLQNRMVVVPINENIINFKALAKD